jgi:deoxyhypusine synthase
MPMHCRKKGAGKGAERFLTGKRVLPKPITKGSSIVDVIDSMDAYNAGRIRAVCELLEHKYSSPDVTIGMSIAGALTPAGLGVSSIIPLMNHGYVDWLVSTGANMYHDLHFAFNLPMYRGSHVVDDKELRREGVTRIYDILFNYEDVLMETDRQLRRILLLEEFQKEMGTAEFYNKLGNILNDFEQKNSIGEVSVLACAYRNSIPVFTSSPGDSTIGMNIAGLESLALNYGFTDRFKLKINPSIDVNYTTAITLDAKVIKKEKTGVILIGGGSPKNFMLQTEPQIQEILGIKEAGQDYDINITDARPDTGGLSGAPPSEAVSWGKVDPDKLEESVTAYTDVTIALPLMTAYILQTTEPKVKRRLYDKRDELNDKLLEFNMKNNSQYEELFGKIKDLPVNHLL